MLDTQGGSRVICEYLGGSRRIQNGREAARIIQRSPEIPGIL